MYVSLKLIVEDEAQMQYAQLRAFHAVAEHGGFSKAAQALSLTQPAISDHVRRLEQDFGVKLFDRGPRGVARSRYESDARRSGYGDPDRLATTGARLNVLYPYTASTRTALTRPAVRTNRYRVSSWPNVSPP